MLPPRRLDDIELVGIDMERESSSQHRRAETPFSRGHTFDVARRMGISKDPKGVSHELGGNSKGEVGHAPVEGTEAAAATADVTADVSTAMAADPVPPSRGSTPLVQAHPGLSG